MSVCAICKQEIPFGYPLSELRHEVIGWEKNRGGAGGHHALELRQRTGAVAHGSCVRDSKRTAGQMNMLDGD